MKRCVALLFIVMAAVLAVGFVALATPKFIHYQGYLTDNTGNPVPDDPPLSILFTIYDNVGVAQWSETQTVSPHSGKFNVKLGSVTEFPEDLFSDIDLYLGIKVGSDNEMTPRTPIGSVPYAFMAGNVPDTSIGSGKIKKHSIVDSLIADTTIGTGKIKKHTIVDSLIADTTIGSGKIKKHSIVDSLIADTTISTGKIKKHSIVDSLIADTTIGVGKIKNHAIVDSLIDDEAVTGTHIRNGTITKQDLGQSGAGTGQVLKWDGDSWEPADDETGAADNDWTLTGQVLYTSDEWGIARYGNILYGQHESTHVNLGVACTTGVNGWEWRYITVGGGFGNEARGEGSVIAGGGENVAGDVSSNGHYSTVGGGMNNRAKGDFSVVAGGGGYEATNDGNEAAGSYSVVSGGRYNRAQALTTTVGGGEGNIADDQGATVGGGKENTAMSSWSTVSGGDSNEALAAYCVIGGGRNNQAGYELPEQGQYATVGGGSNNQATGDLAVVAGGGSVESPGQGNKASGNKSVVSGGVDNDALGLAAAVSGGERNNAYDDYCVVGGGSENWAGSDTPDNSSYGTVGGGNNNHARGEYATIGGGASNAAYGGWSTVPGGYGDSALADYSFAAGYRAKVGVAHQGTFVWSDYSGAPFTSTAMNQFLIKAINGVGINTNSPTEALDVQGNVRVRNMAAGSGTYAVKIDGNGILYQQTSSKRYKENIKPLEVDISRILQLDPASFRWRESGVDDVGLIAEEVAELVPELAIYDKQGRPDGVKYDLVSIYLLDVVKQQQIEIEQLNERVAVNSSLQQQVSQLRAVVEVLMAERNQKTGGSDELAAHEK